MNPCATLSVSQARDLLNLDDDAGPREIRRAYARAVKRAHPDRPGGDAARFHLIVQAYQMLVKLTPPQQTQAESATRARLRRFSAAWAA